jgi:PEP-CTERM motif
MKRLLLLTTAALIALAGSAHAKTYDLAVSGDLSGYDYTGSLVLNVVGNEAVSGGGTLSIVGLKDANLTMITASTAYNETPGIGFRANDGTDFFGADQTFPISTNGLLFDVGTTTAAFREYPLFAIWSDGDGSYSSAFTGKVGDAEYYDLQNSGSTSVAMSAVPEPSTWAMGLLGFGGLGLLGWKKSRANRLAVAV